MLNKNKFNLEQHLQGCISANIPIVLFIGRKVHTLKREIINFPWSCIVTTQSGSDLAVQFRKKDRREVEELDNLAALESRMLFSRRHLKFVHLFKENSDIIPRKRNKAASEMLKFITGRIRSSFGSLLIIGYDAKGKEELPSDRLMETLDDARKQTAFIFSPIEDDENLRDAVKSDILVSFDSPLENFLTSSFLQDEEGDVEVFDENDQIIFVNDKPVSIEKAQLFGTKGFATLLSSEEMDAVKFSNELQRDYFSKFLSESVSMPMWFGYEHSFNLQRKFENDLNKKVESALKNIKDRESQGLIVVSGQTGSSKSIALAHLAYTVYQKRIYPVIFIFDKHASLRYGDANFNALEKLILFLENKGARTVLIIWDNSSASTDPIPSARHLLQALRRRGRQCVLVCSAYMVTRSLDNRIQSNGIKIEEIETEIELSEEETHQLRQKVLTFGSIEASRYDAWIKTQKKQNLLTLLYNIFTETLGSHLANGVRSEVHQTAVTSLIFFKNRFNMSPESINSMAEHLRRAGIECNSDLDLQENIFSKEFQEFLLIIAIASQFGIEMPLQFALTVSGLTKLENNFQYTFRVLQMIPFLRLPERFEDNRSNYGQSIIFRTPLEAMLYLEKSNPEKEIALVVKLIDALQNEHNYMEARALELLIRTVGPNSPLLKNRDQNDQIKKYQSYYHTITEALSRMRVIRKVVIPRLMCQEVCWLREVYGKDTQLPTQERIQKLQEAIDISKNALNKISPNNFSGEELATRNNLIVERATSAWYIHQLQERTEISQGLPYDYNEHRNALEKVIWTAPDNSYAYNALMKLFISMYKMKCSQHEVEELGNILSLLESYEYVMGDVSCNEEFIQHKNDILEFVGEDRVEEFLEELIGQQNPSGLYLWGRRRLMKEEINLDKQVPAEKHHILKDIINFFNNNINLVKIHNGCLLTLLRLKWQLFNGTPIFEKEKQMTKISKQQWEELAEICRGAVPNREYTAQLLYIFALIEAQVSNYRNSLTKQKELQKTLWLPPRSTYVWHILSEEDGTPRMFSGRIEKQDMALRIINVKETNNPNRKIEEKVFSRNRHSLHVDEAAGTFDDFEIGLNFKGFQAFRKLGGGQA